MIPVIWLNLHPHDCHPKQHWDTAIFQELILKGYEEWNGKPEDFPNAAVVMIAGRFHADDVDAINRTLGFMDGCVVVIHSDEESLFPWWDVKHPNMRMWVMTAEPSTKQADFVRFIGEGWSPGTLGILAELSTVVRPFDVAFAGQVTHPRRRQMAGVLDRMWRERPSRIAMHPTDSFAAGFDRMNYLRIMRAAKFAPCPTGPVTADSFRVYEALEAGCIPILDGWDGKGREAYAFWDLVLGPDHHVPILDDWADLPEFVTLALPWWERDAKLIGAWWTDRKQRWVDEMRADVKAISADR